MSKLYYGFFVFWLLLPQTANAVLIVPSADVTVVVNTAGGESSFNFEFSGSGPFSYFENFSLTTQNGLASHTVHIPFLTGAGFQLKQNLPSGWELDNVTCSGSFSTSGNTVQLSILPFTTTTCTFFNEKITQKNPVLFIPGIVGTELFNNNEKLWPNIAGMISDIGDQFLDPLALTGEFSSSYGITQGNVVGKIEPQGIFKLYDYTYGLKTEFEVNGYQEGVDLFMFPYDWRFGAYDQNLLALKNKIEAILTETGASKVDVVAHSAGGVLLKKYILDNTNHRVGKAVFVGVPNLGAPKALKLLLEGDNLDIPVLSAKEIKKIVRNMPGVYQLTPSNEYQNTAGAFFATHTQNLFSSSDIDFSFAEMQGYLASNKDLNGNGFAAANELHSSLFDLAEIGSRGVDVYNIVGCKQPTLGKIIERKTQNLALRPIVNGYAAKFVAGDGTVPLVSAEKTPAPGSPIFYALNSNHGKMPSQDGIRQGIVKLITGDSSIMPTGIAQDRNQCKLNGKEIAIYSPLVISVTDALGNITQVTANGDVQTDIPGSNLEILSDHKFLFLPEGQDYSIKVEGTDIGSFTLVTDEIVNDQITQREVFADVPVSASLKGSFDINRSQLELDSNGDGIIEQILQPYELGQDQLNDSIAPISQAILNGIEGEPHYFRSNVNLTLSAADDLSGVLNIKYILNSGELINYTGPVSITSEGSHVLNYFSVDRAGNVESAKTIELTIDKNPPEIAIQFNPAIQDLEFTGTDNLSESISIQDQDDLVVLKDQAGNTSKLVLKEKDRKHKLKAEIKQLLYNGVEADISKNKLVFNWKYQNNSLKSLVQHVKSKREFNIQAEYNGIKTEIKGKESTGAVNQNFNNLVLLKLKTLSGDFTWTY